jgi:glycosyltransferase involved in cell wall biosynthesis
MRSTCLLIAIDWGHAGPGSRLMRIALYYPRALVGDGGMSWAVRRLANGLANAGGDVTVLFDEHGELPSGSGVRWVAVRHRKRRLGRVPVGLEESLSGSDVLVLHSAWAAHNIKAARVARRAGVPYVLAPRGAYDPHILRRKRFLKGAWWLGLERPLLRHARAVHVFFDSERAHLRALKYPGQVIVAPNGVDPQDEARWDGGSGGYVLWIGRFDPEHKGLDLLLRAVAQLPRPARPSIRLHGPDWRGRKQAVRTMVDELQLRDSVTVAEPVYEDAKRDVLARASGFVYPSRWEGFGNSVAEAVSMAVPSLVTPYPLGRYLADRGGAFLAEPTPAGLAAGLEELTSPRAGEVGRTGAEVVRRELSWDSVARSWLSQLEDVV